VFCRPRSIPFPARTQYITKDRSTNVLASVVSLDRQRGLPEISMNNAKVIKVRGDGHCLYSALAKGSMNNGEDLRQIICDEISSHPDKIAYSDVSYANDVQMNHNTSIDHYVSMMRSTDGSLRSYGGALEIHAFCLLKGFSTVVYCIHNNSYSPMQVHHVTDGFPIICLIYKGGNTSAHYDLLQLTSEAEDQLAVDLHTLNQNNLDTSVMNNHSGSESKSSLSNTMHTDYDDNLPCIGYVVTKQLEVDNEADDEVYVFVKDVSYSLGIQSEIQIKNLIRGSTSYHLLILNRRI